MDINKGPIREPVVDGIFYPDNKKDLKKHLDQFFKHSSQIPKESKAIISPNASLNYSGLQMVNVFKASANSKVKRAVIIGPVVRSNSTGIFLTESVKFRTPLGLSEVDQEAMEMVSNTATNLSIYDIYHMQEHSIELQQLFIQYLWPEAKILPILVSGNTEPVLKTLGAIIRTLDAEFGEELLFVLSMNLSRFGEQCLVKTEADTIHGLIMEKDYETLISYSSSNVTSPGLIILSSYLKSKGYAEQVELIERSNSKAMQQTSEEVIEYGSYRFF